MNVSTIGRFTSGPTSPLTFTNSGTTTGRFALGSFAGAMLFCESTSTGNAVTLTFEALQAFDATAGFVVADDSNTVVELAVQPNRAYPLPDQLFAACFIRALTASGSATCRLIYKG
jgi:hypothetical protein